MCVASSPSRSKACGTAGGGGAVTSVAARHSGRQKATLVSIRAALAAVRVR